MARKTSQKKKQTKRRAKRASGSSSSPGRAATPEEVQARIEAGGVSDTMMAFFHSRVGRAILTAALVALVILITLVLTRHRMKLFYTLIGAEILIAWTVLTVYSLRRRR